jgi:hypothetical protein
MIQLCSGCGIVPVDVYSDFGLCYECRQLELIEIGERPEGSEDWDNECEDDYHGD